MKLTPLDPSKWDEVVSEKRRVYRSTAGGELTVSISQKRRIAEAIKFAAFADGAWILDAEVNGQTCLSHRKLNGESTIDLPLSGCEDMPTLEVTLRLIPLETMRDPDQPPQRIDISQEVEVVHNGPDLVGRHRVAATVTAVALVYLAICVGEVLAKLPVLNDLAIQVQAVMALLGLGMVWTKYLQVFVHIMSRRMAVLAAGAGIAAVLAIMLWDWTAYLVRKDDYISDVRELAQDVGAVRLDDITRLMTEFPNRPEAYILSEAAAYVAPLGERIEDVAPGNEDRQTIRSHFRAVFEITEAFDGDSVIDESMVQESLSVRCSHPDATAAPIRFVSVFEPASWSWDLVGTSLEDAEGCEFAIERIRAAFTPLLAPMSEEMWQFARDLTNVYPHGTFRNDREERYVLTMGAVLLGPCNLNDPSKFDGSACVRDFATARSQAMRRLREEDQDSVAHSTQFYHSDLALQAVLICQQQLENSQDASEIKAMAVENIQLLLDIRNNRGQNGLGVWPVPPARLSMYLALTGDEGAIQYSRGRQAILAVRACFGRDLDAFWDRIELRGVIEPSKAEWWRQSSIEAFRDGSGVDHGALINMVNLFLSTGWRL